MGDMWSSSMVGPTQGSGGAGGGGDDSSFDTGAWMWGLGSNFDPIIFIIFFNCLWFFGMNNGRRITSACGFLESEKCLFAKSSCLFARQTCTACGVPNEAI